MEILLLDNKSQYSGELTACLEDLGVELDIQSLPGAASEWEHSGVIISGGAIPHRDLSETLNQYQHLLNNLTKPLLAICLGLKIMAYCYGARIRKMETPEVGLTSIQFHKSYPLAPSRSKLIVYEDHIFELFSLPNILENYGSSEQCKIQAVKHKWKPQFGVQFHPEKNGNNDGHLIIENFVRLCYSGGY
ncbi:MAG: hypothetical protein QXJ75_02305 [Candidatus Bathyarchaeia archaeon]